MRETGSPPPLRAQRGLDRPNRYRLGQMPPARFPLDPLLRRRRRVSPLRLRISGAVSVALHALVLVLLLVTIEPRDKEEFVPPASPVSVVFESGNRKGPSAPKPSVAPSEAPPQVEAPHRHRQTPPRPTVAPQPPLPVPPLPALPLPCRRHLHRCNRTAPKPADEVPAPPPPQPEAKPAPREAVPAPPPPPPGPEAEVPETAAPRQDPAGAGRPR